MMTIVYLGLLVQDVTIPVILHVRANQPPLRAPFIHAYRAHEPACLYPIDSMLYRTTISTLAEDAIRVGPGVGWGGGSPPVKNKIIEQIPRYKAVFSLDLFSLCLNYVHSHFTSLHIIICIFNCKLFRNSTFGHYGNFFSHKPL